MEQKPEIVLQGIEKSAKSGIAIQLQLKVNSEIY